jgi:hypothetical protein
MRRPQAPGHGAQGCLRPQTALWPEAQGLGPYMAVAASIRVTTSCRISMSIRSFAFAM